MKNKSVGFIIFIDLLLIVASLLTFQNTSLDLIFQNLWFNPINQTWFIDKNELVGKFIFYNLPKILLGVLILLTLVMLIFSYSKPRKWLEKTNSSLLNLEIFRSQFLERQRQKILILFLGLTLIPLTVGNIKKITNIYCPSQLEIYGGSYPYVKILSPYPIDFIQNKRGKCFPAGHAVTGFCLMILFFIFNKRSHRFFGLILGLILGWIMGLYQIAKGAHFLSDTVLSMLACFLVASLIFKFVVNFSKDNSCK